MRPNIIYEAKTEDFRVEVAATRESIQGSMVPMVAATYAGKGLFGAGNMYWGGF